MDCLFFTIQIIDFYYVIGRRPDGNLGLPIPDNLINEGRQILLNSFSTHGIYIKEIRPLSALPFV
jgi:hypothetical protein